MPSDDAHNWHMCRAAMQGWWGNRKNYRARLQPPERGLLQGIIPWLLSMNCKVQFTIITDRLHSCNPNMELPYAEDSLLRCYCCLSHQNGLDQMAMFNPQPRYPSMAASCGSSHSVPNDWAIGSHTTAAHAWRSDGPLCNCIVPALPRTYAETRVTSRQWLAHHYAAQTSKVRLSQPEGTA